MSTTATDASQLLLEAAGAAAARCGARIRELENVEELSRAFDLFNRIWGGEDQGSMPVNVMKAMTHSRNYVAGAWSGGRLVGASVGFCWGDPEARSLHSHISGVVAGEQGHGVGYALKLHQRAWAHERGMSRITWTFDPLVRRNGWFNLAKLGARIEGYHPDFYGEMRDSINGGDATDRCVVAWDVQPGPAPAPAPDSDRPAPLVLLRGADGGVPWVKNAGHQSDWEAAPVLACQVPEDAIELRRAAPELALQWRHALRSTMGAAIAAGYVASAITRDGFYLLERSSDEVRGG